MLAVAWLIGLLIPKLILGAALCGFSPYSATPVRDAARVIAWCAGLPFFTSAVLAFIRPVAARHVFFAVAAPTVVVSAIFGSMILLGGEQDQIAYPWLIIAIAVVGLAAGGAALGRAIRQFMDRR